MPGLLVLPASALRPYKKNQGEKTRVVTSTDALMSVIRTSFSLKGHPSECLTAAGQGFVTEHRHDHPNVEPELL